MGREMEDMLVYQSNPMGVEFYSYVDTFVEFMLHTLCTEIVASKVKLYKSMVSILSILSLSVFQRKLYITHFHRGAVIDGGNLTGYH